MPLLPHPEHGLRTSHPHLHLHTCSMHAALRATSSALQVAERASDEPHACLVSAFLEGEALVLGRYQRAEDTLTEATLPHLVRRTGGPAWRASQGSLYVALVLSHREALTPTPEGKLMNRNLRGLIQLGRALGAPFVYGGRELLSTKGRLIGAVAHTTTHKGACLIECLIGVEDSVLPSAEQVDDGWMGPRWPMPWSSLKACGLVTTHEAILAALRASHAAFCASKFAGLQDEVNHIEIVSISDEAGLTWSRCIAVPAGLVTVGVDACRIVVRGDVMQDEGADARLAAAWCETRDARAALQAAYPHGLPGVPLDALAMLVEEAREDG